MKIHCDKCDRYLGDYLYGIGGVSEKARISGGNKVSMPDIVCFECESLGLESKYYKF
jgi:hypothetical protein